MGVPADLQITKDGQAKIFANLGNYLWFSLFEIAELHFPYTNGWGRVYNVGAMLSTAFLYLGCLFGLRTAFRWPEFLLFAGIALYVTGLFILTDATPRYLVPIIFCYALLAGIGYDVLISRIWRR